jgi:hypothetical protein
MTGIVAIILAAAASVPTPNHRLTPGQRDPAVTQANIQQTICKPGYSDSVRKTPARVLKAMFDEYGIPDAERGNYEGDHLISLELGGADTLKNLWPQRYCPTKRADPNCFGAREKDVVETTFKRRICKGQMTLRDAQRRIAKDWYAEYRAIKGLP